MLRAAAFGVLMFLASTAFAESNWKFVSVAGSPARGDAEIIFGEADEFSGGTGCNRFSGKGSFANGVLTVSQPLATTRKACADPEIDKQEQNLLTLLQGSILVTYDPFLEQVVLQRDDRVAALEYRATAAEAGLGSSVGPTTVMVSDISGRLNIRETPSVSSDVVSKVAPRSVLKSLECKRGADRDWCRLSLGDGKEGWAAAEYLVPVTVGRRAKNGTFNRVGRLDCADADGGNPGRCEYGAAFEPGHVIVAVFVDAGPPKVVHFRDGEVDPLATVGPFRAADLSTQSRDEFVQVSIDGFRMEVPRSVATP